MSVSGLPMQLRVPADARFRSIVLTMARRIAESVGLSTSDAGALGEELADRAAAAARQGGAEASTPLDVTFEIAGPGGTVLRVLARCGSAAVEVTRPLPGA
jgi:hypothetical protein